MAAGAGAGAGHVVAEARGAVVVEGAACMVPLHVEGDRVPECPKKRFRNGMKNNAQQT